MGQHNKGKASVPPSVAAMPGGIIQLVSLGEQDDHLTRDAEISFFRSHYRRHTNFALESIPQTLNGKASPGGRMSAVLSRSGDLVHRVWLEFDLPAVPASMPATPPCAGSRFAVSLRRSAAAKSVNAAPKRAASLGRFSKRAARAAARSPKRAPVCCTKT